MKPAVAILGGSRASVGFCEAAHAKGLYSVVIDRDANAYCGDYCDVLLPISTHDHRAIGEGLIGLGDVDMLGIVSYSSHPDALRSASALTEEFGCPGYPRDAVDVSYDKDRLRAVLTGCGVPMPTRFVTDDITQSPESLAGRLRFPCVIKPTRGIGSGGVRYLQNVTDLRTYVATSGIEMADTFVEEYCEGYFVHVDGYVQNRSARILSIAEKFVEFRDGIPLTRGYRLIDDEDTILREHDLPRIREYMERGVRAVGINNHLFGADVILPKSGDPRFLEIGFLLDAKMDRLLYHAGFPVYDCLLEIAMGNPIDHGSLAGPSTSYALRFLYTDQTGHLCERKESERDLLIEWERLDNDCVSPPLSIADIVGWVVASGGSSADAWKKCSRDTSDEFFTVA